MATIANLLIGLGVDFGGVSKGLNRGAKGLQSGLASMRVSLSGMNGIMQSIENSAQAVGAALAGALKSGLRTALQLAAEAETAQVQFEVMLGSAETAASLLEDISKFAAATPFESTELRAAAKQLLAFGTSGEQVVPTLRMLGDLAAGTGQPIEELASIYGKAQTAGRLFMEDVNQLGDRNINVLQIWSDKLGKTVPEIRAMVSEGKFGFRDLQEALIELTGEGGRFGGMMEKQSQTLAGMWSTAVDTAKTAALQFGNAMLKWADAKDVLGGLLSAVGEIDKTLNAVSTAVEDTSATTAQWADSWLNGLEFVTRGLAHVLDFFGFLKDGWDLIVGGMKSGVGVIIDALAWLLEKAEAAASKLPKALGGGAGVDLGAAALRESAAEWADAGAAAIDDALADMSERTNAEGVTEFFRRVREGMQQTTAAATEAAGAVELVESALAANANGGKGSLATMEERLGLAKELARVERDTAIEAATRGSSEAFSAIRQFRSEGRGGMGRNLEKLTDAALRELELQRENNRMIRRFVEGEQAVEILN